MDRSTDQIRSIFPTMNTLVSDTKNNIWEEQFRIVSFKEKLPPAPMTAQQMSNVLDGEAEILGEL